MTDNRGVDFIRGLVDRELENTRNDLWNRTLSMSNAQPIVLKGGILFCPACNKFFSDEHADRRPNFCEECGQAFQWTGDKE